MRIAVYYDLPNGGAKRTMESILPLLAKRHTLIDFSTSESSSKFSNRIVAEIYTFFVSRLKQKQIAREIKRQNTDFVLVTHDRYLQAPWILRYLSKPSVFICQEPTRALFEKFLDVDPHLPFINRLFEKLIRFFRRVSEVKNASYAKRIIANSYYSAESIFRCYGQVAEACHLGVDREIFFPTATKKLNQVLVVGNNEPQKALAFAVESCGMITKNRPSLVIACPRDNDLEPIMKLAKKRGVRLVIKLGLTQAELAKEYNSAKATLACAYLEPFGLSAVESIACGTPVVAVAEAGFRETVTENVTGLLTSRKESEFAKAIEKCLKDKSLAKKTEAEGPKIVKSKFSWQAFVEKIETKANELN